MLIAREIDGSRAHGGSGYWRNGKPYPTSVVTADIADTMFLFRRNNF